jgi:benzoyl-CoA reductase/2-hydroxyglutaryl-CoA dehydratase subunit BcrC/BadD/HgdB
MFIPYNAYRLDNGELKAADILQKRHINPDHARYELHRVWVVEGTVKVAERNPNALRLEDRGHQYSRRVFYLDEDSWQLALADNYDRNGNLWRVSEGHMINFYEVPVPWYNLEVFYDLQQERYVVVGLNNQRQVTTFDDQINPRLFGPNALDYYVR